VEIAIIAGVGAGNHDGERASKLILGKFCPAGLQSRVREGRGLGRQDTGYCVSDQRMASLATTECVRDPDGVSFLQILLVVVIHRAIRRDMDDAFVDWLSRRCSKRSQCVDRSHTIARVLAA